jgi:hypothetical protein
MGTLEKVPMKPLSMVDQALESAGLIRGLPPSEIEARLLTFLRPNDTSQRMLAFYLHEMDTGRRYEESGHTSTAHYAEEELGLDWRDTDALVAIGRKLLTLPAIDHAFCTGVIGWSKVMLLLGVATPENEDAWLERAKALWYRDLVFQVRLARPGSAPRRPSDLRVPPEPLVKVEFPVDATALRNFQRAKELLAAECGRPVSDAECFEIVNAHYLSVLDDDSVPG